MYKTLTIASILVVGLFNMQAYASEEAEQIWQDCELQVQSYDITDPEEYSQALNDCIESMSPRNPMQLDEGENLPADQT